jgi:hypothetical protein
MLTLPFTNFLQPCMFSYVIIIYPKSLTCSVVGVLDRDFDYIDWRRAKMLEFGYGGVHWFMNSDDLRRYIQYIDGSIVKGTYVLVVCLPDSLCCELDHMFFMPNPYICCVDKYYVLSWCFPFLPPLFYIREDTHMISCSYIIIFGDEWLHI